MSPSVYPDAARHLNKLDLVSLTFRTVLSGKSYNPHCTKRKLRCKEVNKPLLVARALECFWMWLT